MLLHHQNDSRDLCISRRPSRADRQHTVNPTSSTKTQSVPKTITPSRCSKHPVAKINTALTKDSTPAGHNQENHTWQVPILKFKHKPNHTATPKLSPKNFSKPRQFQTRYRQIKSEQFVISIRTQHPTTQDHHQSAAKHRTSQITLVKNQYNQKLSTDLRPKQSPKSLNQTNPTTSQPRLTDTPEP